MRPTFDFRTLYAYVGSICVHATWLEQELEDSVTLLAGDDRVASIVRGQRGSNLVSAITRLIKDGGVKPEYADRLLAVVKRAEKVLDQRDLIVHTVWLKTHQNREGHITGTRTRAASTDRREWSFADLEAVRAEMEKVRNDLSTFTHNAVAHEKDWGLMPEPEES